MSPAECCLDVAVYALTGDFGRTKGLCGNYNGVMDDDLTLRRSNSSRMDHGSSSNDSTSIAVEPFEFAQRYWYAA